MRKWIRWILHVLEDVPGYAVLIVFGSLPFLALALYHLPGRGVPWDAFATSLLAMLWLFGLGWYAARGRHQAVVFFGLIFLVLAPLISWYWAATAYDRSFAHRVNAEDSLHYWRMQKGYVSDREWTDENLYRLSELKMAEGQGMIALADSKKRSPWPYLIMSGTGIALMLLWSNDRREKPFS